MYKPPEGAIARDINLDFSLISQGRLQKVLIWIQTYVS